MKAFRFLPLAVLLVMLSACSISLAEDLTPPPGYEQPVQRDSLPTAVPIVLEPANQAPDAAAGEAIYQESCAPCHGDAGLGDGDQADQLPNPASPIGDPELARPSLPLEWYGILTEGRMDRFMPPFGPSLTDQQRWDVLAYAYLLSTTSEQLARGEELYAENCASCHGESGRGAGPESTGLAATLPDFTATEFFADHTTDAVYQAITDGAGIDMPAYAAELSDEQRWALADYVRTLSYARPDTEVASVDPPEAGSAAEGESQAGQQPSSSGGAAAEEPVEVISGKVTGVLTNGSGGDIPAGLPVTLHGFDHIEEVFTTSSVVAEDGSYIFEDVEMPESRVFIVTIDYSEATYNSDLAIVEPGTDVINLPVTVYDTTDDNSELVVDRLHIFIEPLEENMMHVVELYLLSNPTDKVVVGQGADDIVVHYKLPPEADGLTFQQATPDGRFVITVDGFGDTMNIPPGTGQYQVMYAYDMPYDGKLEVKHDLTLPVNSVVLLVPDVGLNVRGEQFQDNGVSSFQGQNFEVFTRDRVAAGTELEIAVSDGSGIASTLFGAPAEQNSLLAGGLIFGLSLIVVGFLAVRHYYFLPKREAVAVSGAGVPAPAPPAESKFDDVDSVLDAIIALDDMYTSGNLSEAAYTRRRTELFESLKELKESGDAAE
ncbi:MAG: c-type cytochrome [Anaerolineales bacterium]|nr:c-type cytochrome [Anaerolineales bacterium]